MTGDKRDLTRRALGLGAAAATLASASARGEPGADASERYRPRMHYTPRVGFMNDPNGLIHHDGEWHLYYQYNPFGTRSAHVHWGHAVSPDLLHWQELPPALGDTEAGEPFSGSAVFDADNTSRLFPAGEPGLVAVFTRATPEYQRQDIACSIDRGRSFALYDGNPVLERGSNSFRDPKVFWHEPTRRWIMAVVAAREHRVLFYASANLTQWQEVGSFSQPGIEGVEYECPNLVLMPVEGGGLKWVLFVSVNTGPEKNSPVQYFVGAFDGQRFTADDPATRYVDFGKDFYAMQVFADAPGDRPVAMAWAGCWQYCNDLPTGAWRGVMTLPRRLSLRQAADGCHLVQAFAPLEALRGAAIPVRLGEGGLATATLPPGAAVEVRVRLTVDAGGATLAFRNGAGEALTVGFDQGSGRLNIARGGTRGFKHQHFTDGFTATRPPGTREMDLHLVLDRCTLEVIGFNGEVSGTFLHFFATPPDQLVVQGAGAVRLGAMQVTELT